MKTYHHWHDSGCGTWHICDPTGVVVSVMFRTIIEGVFEIWQTGDMVCAGTWEMCRKWAAENYSIPVEMQQSELFTVAQ